MTAIACLRMMNNQNQLLYINPWIFCVNTNVPDQGDHSPSTTIADSTHSPKFTKTMNLMTQDALIFTKGGRKPLLIFGKAKTYP